MPIPRDSRVERWQRDLTGIGNEVVGLHHNRVVYRTVAGLVEEHGELPPSLFFDYFRNTYGVTQAAAIRRQAERHPARVVSLASLMSEIRDDPARLTCERFAALYDAEMLHIGRATFNEHFAGNVGTHVDPEIVEHDLDGLAATAEAIRRYVDRHIAHTDRTPLERLPTFGDLDEAIDAVGRLFTKYALLLTASSWMTLEPVIQHDWLAIFRQAWIRDGLKHG